MTMRDLAADQINGASGGTGGHAYPHDLARVVRDAIVVVISQDGGLRFVRWHDDAVTYWDQVATGPWEV